MNNNLMDFMFRRINYKSVSPELYETMLGFSRYLGKSSLEQSLIDLIEIRASQINGCAWCLDMHTDLGIMINKIGIKSPLKSLLRSMSS